MTQLMFKIANEPPLDILAVNPTLPECLVEIINIDKSMLFPVSLSKGPRQSCRRSRRNP